MKLPTLIPLLLLTGCAFSVPDQLIVSGQIEGIGVDVGSKIGGRVKEVLAKEGDHVEAGAVLIRLEDDESRALVDAAKAQLDTAQATLDKLNAGARVEEIEQAKASMDRMNEQYQMAVKGARIQEVETAKAAVESAQAQRDNAHEDFVRAEKLVQQSAVSKQAYDKATHALSAAEAQLKSANERLDMVIEGTRVEELGMAKAAYEQARAAYELLKNGARKEDIAAAQAARDSAAANLARAEVNAREMVISTPRAGVIESLDVHPGDLVRAGAIARVVDPEDLEIMIYVSEGVLGKLRLGQKVSLTTDSHGDKTFEGIVEQVATEGEYTPRNLQTEEERVQQVFGIKLKLNSANGDLRPGMTATAHLDFTEAATS